MLSFCLGRITCFKTASVIILLAKIAKQEITSCPSGRYTRGLQCQIIFVKQHQALYSYATSRKPFSKRFFRSYWIVLLFCGWFWVVPCFSNNDIQKCENKENIWPTKMPLYMRLYGPTHFWFTGNSGEGERENRWLPRWLQLPDLWTSTSQDKWYAYFNLETQRNAY